MDAWNSSSEEVETGGENHPWLQKVCEASLGYLRFHGLRPDFFFLRVALGVRTKGTCYHAQPAT